MKLIRTTDTRVPTITRNNNNAKLFSIFLHFKRNQCDLL